MKKTKLENLKIIYNNNPNWRGSYYVNKYIITFFKEHCNKKQYSFFSMQGVSRKKTIVKFFCTYYCVNNQPPLFIPYYYDYLATANLNKAINKNSDKGTKITKNEQNKKS